MKQLQFIKPLVMLMALTMAVLIPDRVCAQVSPMIDDEPEYVVLNDGDNNVTVLNPTTGSEWSENKWDSENYTFFMYEVKADGDVRFTIETDVSQALLFCVDKYLSPYMGYFNGSKENYIYMNDVKAGTVYYIGVRGYEDAHISSCNINILSKAACASGQHTMTYVPGSSETCTKHGYLPYYHCDSCDLYYTDEAGTQRIINTHVFPLGHDYDLGGNCQREGCGYKAVELTIGDNKVNINSITDDYKWSTEPANPNNYALFKYTVLADGNLTIKSVGDAYIYGMLYDSDMQPIYEDWGYPNMLLSKNNVHAGEVYYIGTRCHWYADIENYTINIDAPLPPCAPGEHQLTHFAEQLATCTSSGNVEYWHCGVCKNYFADEECKNQIFDTVTPALGHDLDADDKCKREGCNFEVIKLSSGDNYVNILNPTIYEEWTDDRGNIQHYTVFKYVVKFSGNVTITAVGDKDTYGVLYDKSLNTISHSDDDNGPNFRFVIPNAQKGDVYYIGARGFGSNYIGQYIINVDSPIPPCSPGSHTFTYSKGTPATCTQNGTIGYYYCSTCDRNYVDAEGTTEVNNFIAPALGHSFAEDGKCQHEGCNETIVVLKDGENTVDVHTPTTFNEWNWSQESKNFSLYLYKATADGDVVFHLRQDYEATCILYDSDYNVLADKLNTAGYYFWFTYSGVKAGDILLLGVRGVFGDDTNSTITVESVPSCAPGEHSMSYVEEKAVTCTTDGIMAHYHCSKCSFDYDDEAGEKRIVETVIISLGHDYDNNGNCQREGCGYKAIELKRGDNSVDLYNITPYDNWLNTSLWDTRHYNLMKYTVKADGNLTIRSFGKNSVYGILYDKNMQHVVDNWGYPNITLTVNDVHAGDVFYLGMRNYLSSVTEEYIINIDAPIPSMCEPGTHNMQHNETVPATCTNNGTIAYYYCDVCDRNFADAEGTEEIDNLVIPALGHRYDNDGKCQNEGCDATISVLHDGNNDLSIKNLPDNDYNYSLFLYKMKNDGDVYFSIVSDEEVAYVVYDSNMNVINISDYYYYDFYPSIQNVSAGENIIIGIRNLDDSSVSQTNINVRTELACAPGEHDLTFMPDEISVTCKTEGLMPHYHCNNCNFDYIDEECTKRLVNVIIPPLGHDYDHDGNCQREGCGYKVVELNRGNNKVDISDVTNRDYWNWDRNPRNYNLMKYTVQFDGDVTIQSVSDNFNVFGILYDSDFNEVYSMTGYNNFIFYIENAHAGDVYYIGARGCWDNLREYQTIRVDATLPPACDPGHHNLQQMEAVPPTCIHDGKVEHYYCDVCGRSYSDAECTTEIEDISVPALGHEFDVDGKCKHEGCNEQLNIVNLERGNNNVYIENPTSWEEWYYDQTNLKNYSLFKYVVRNSGEVVIQSVGNVDTYGVLYDSTFNPIDTNDNFVDSNAGFYIGDAQKGDVYFIGIRGYDSNVGKYIINVEAPLPPECEPGQHKMQYIEGVAATCTQSGLMDRYYCDVCDRIYKDAEGTQSINDIVIPNLGHNFGADDCCQREGCDVSIVELKIGDNAVNIQNITSGIDWEHSSNARHYTMFKFKVQADGDVTVKTVGGLDTYGALYNSNWEIINTFDADGDNWNDFAFTIEDAKAGEVYYIGARGYYDIQIGDYIIHVDAKEDNLATGISSIQNADDEKAFNTMGQRVGKSTKGIVIINGRTVVRK